jgi:hypothetical protein
MANVSRRVSAAPRHVHGTDWRDMVGIVDEDVPSPIASEFIQNQQQVCVDF